MKKMGFPTCTVRERFMFDYKWSAVRLSPWETFIFPRAQ